MKCDRIEKKSNLKNAKIIRKIQYNPRDTKVILFDEHKKVSTLPSVILTVRNCFEEAFFFLSLMYNK